MLPLGMRSCVARCAAVCLIVEATRARRVGIKIADIMYYDMIATTVVLTGLHLVPDTVLYS